MDILIDLGENVESKSNVVQLVSLMKIEEEKFAFLVVWMAGTSDNFNSMLIKLYFPNGLVLFIQMQSLCKLVGNW